MLFFDRDPSEYMKKAMAQASPPWVVSDEDKNDIMRKLEEDFIEDFRRQYMAEQLPSYKRVTAFGFLDVAPLIKNAVNCIVKDSFTICFQSHPPRKWNWNAYLMILYVCGIFCRYCLLFPLR
jgi:hypothetical protein